MKSIIFNLYSGLKKFVIGLTMKLRYQLYLWRGYSLGKNVSIGPGVKMGRGVILGDQTTLVGQTHIEGKVKIGSNVIVAAGCTILGTSHNYNLCDALPYGTAYQLKGVTIEDNVWLGANVQVAPGVTIGEGAVIGLGAVVAKDVPACAVAAGNPARIVKYRDQDRYQRLIREQKYLNRIRATAPHRSRDIRKNRATFQHLMNSRGFVLNIELVSTTPEWRSAILYELGGSQKCFRFGNAERCHIVVDTARIPTVDETILAQISQIISTSSQYSVDRQVLEQDLEELVS